MSCKLEKASTIEDKDRLYRPYCVDQDTETFCLPVRPSYFGPSIQQKALQVELANLRSENNRLKMALDAISGTIAIYRANQP